MKKDSPYRSEGMWKDAPPSSFSKAAGLRMQMTDAEKLLWEELRNKNFQNLKFRRQHPVHLYIADFYCHELKLVVEIDGEYHHAEDQILKDNERTGHLNAHGLEVIRFTNSQVMQSLDSVLQAISDKASQKNKQISRSGKIKPIFPQP